MSRYDNEWDRDRERERRDRERGYVNEPGRQEYPPSGQSFNQGGYGGYGSQGDRSGDQYGGRGSGVERGYWGRESSGGMGSYLGGRGRWGERREYGEETEGWNRENERPDYWGRNQDRDPSRSGMSAREGGWGGYGSYDRQRGNVERGRMENEGGRSFNNPDRETREWGRGPSWSSDYGRSSYGGSSGQGGHYGRGPRNYKRSDQRIEEDINEQLTRHHDIDATDVEVEVRNGEVTLKGMVDDRHAKRMAEDCAEQVSGVKQVHNMLRVEQRQDQNLFTAGHGAATSSGQPAGSSQQNPSVQRQGELTSPPKK